MTDSARLPAPLASRAKKVLGPLHTVHDASHSRDSSKVWKVTGRAGDHDVKVAPEPALHARETRADSEAVPRLGRGNVPALKDSSDDLHEGLLRVPMEKPPPDCHPCSFAIFRMLTLGPSYRALNRPSLGGAL